MKRTRIVVTLVSLGVAVACAQPGQVPAGGTQADQQAFNQLREQEIAAFSAGDIDKLLALLTDDAVVMAPNEPALIGKDAVRSWLQKMYQQFKIEGAYTSSADLVVVGDWAFERVAFKLKLTPVAGGSSLEDVGKGFHVYRRQADGSWKIARDIWNSDISLSPAS